MFSAQGIARAAMATAKVLEILDAAEALGKRMSEEQWAGFSEKLACKIVGALENMTVAPADVARLGQAVSSSKMREADRDAVLGKLTAALMAEGDETCAQKMMATGGPSKMQNWTTAGDFLPESVWVAMQNGQYDIMIGFLLKMGLYYPNEHTTKTLGLAFACASQGMTAVRDCAPHTRLAVVKMWKQLFRTAASRKLVPECLVRVLPPTPSQWQEECPARYKDLYEKEPPRSLPFNRVEFLEIVHTSRCRSERAFAMPCARPCSPASRGYRDAIDADRIGLRIFGSQRRSLSPLPIGNQRALELFPALAQTPDLPAPPPLPLAPAAPPPPLPLAPAAQRTPPAAQPTPPLPLAPAASTPEPAPEKQVSAEAAAPPCLPRKPALSVDAAVAAMCQSVEAKASAKKSGAIVSSQASGGENRAVLKRPAAAKGTNEGAGKDSSTLCPQISHEASREQFLARTGGKGPGSTKTFRYGAGQAYDYATAERCAKKQVQDWCKEFGAPIPKKAR